MNLRNFLKIAGVAFLIIFSFADTFAKENLIRKNALLILSRDMTHPWTSTIVDSMMKELHNFLFDLRIDAVELNAERNYNEVLFEKRLATRFEKISQNYYDIIITLGDPALDVLLKNRDKAKLSAPVVFAGYEKDTSNLKDIYPNLTGVRQKTNIEKTIQQGIKFYPDTKKILVVCDSTKNGLILKSRLNKIKIGEVKIETIGTNGESISEILDKIESEPINTITLLSAQAGIKESDYRTSAALAIDMGDSSKRPYLICDISMLGYGALGGWFSNPEEQAKCLMWLAEETLKNGSAKKIKLTETQARPFFDWRIIEREHLDQSKLPPYSIIKNQPANFFDLYRTQIIAAAFAFVAMICVFSSHIYISHRAHGRTIKMLKSFPGRLGVFDENGNVLFINTGRNFETANIKHINDLVALSCDMFVDEAKIALEQGVRRTFEYTHGESHRAVIISPLPEEIFNKKTAVWVATDTTELSQAREVAERLERENSRAQARYRRAARLWSIVIDSIPTNFFVKDADNNFRYVLCNDALAKFLGKKKEKIIGKIDTEIFDDKQQAEIFRARDAKIMAQSKSEAFEEYCIDAHGEMRCMQTIKLPFVDEDGGKMLIGMSNDVTELNSLYKTQIAMTECLEKILANKDGKEGASFALKVLCEQTGASRGVILKLRTNNTLTSYSEYTSSGLNKIFENVELSTPPTDSEWTSFENLDKNSEMFDEKWRDIIKQNDIRFMRAFRVDADGKPWGYILVMDKNGTFINDDAKKKAIRSFANFIEVIIEREYARVQLLSALEEARKANKTKSYFIASVSHEIRTPLNGVIGFAELLRDENVSKEEREQYLESIVFGGNALLQLVNDVLDLSKLESGSIKILPELSDFKSIADGVEKLFALKAAEKQIELLLDIPDDMPILMFDKMKIRQILLNLVGNAVKFTSQGYVSVWAKFEPNNSSTGTFTFAVTDTGEGISKENIEKIMDPFMQLKLVRDSDGFNQGTGLGLPISKRLAEKMGGEIWLESELSKGSTFGVTLKNIAYGKIKPTTVVKEEENLPLNIEKNISVLIVDDVQMNRKVLKAMFEKMGVIDVVTANNASDALKILSERKFSIALTDLWMPDITGEEFAQKVRENPEHNNMPIIAVTADIEARDNFNMDMFSSILLKPVTVAKIEKIISSAMKKQLG